MPACNVILIIVGPSDFIGIAYWFKRLMVRLWLLKPHQTSMGLHTQNCELKNIHHVVRDYVVYVFLVNY